MNTWVQVDKLQDEEPVNAKTLNRPVDQLASRTDYLKKRLGTILDEGVQSSLVLTDVSLIQDENDDLKVGNIVYRDKEGFRKAQANMSLYDDFTAAESAFTLGILISEAGNVGDVLIYGKLDLTDSSLIYKENIIQSGETFRSGRYYLSATEAGKLTAYPSGPLIYVGSLHSSSTVGSNFSPDAIGYINPQFLDIGTSHVHRAYSLMARPAGSVRGTDVIGYLPVGAVDESSESSSDSEDGKSYPTLIFDGTWTSIEDVNYVFTLHGNTWGNVKLNWYKNGDTSQYSQVDIPASNVFVTVDNGLRVKVIFPDATNTQAYDQLTDAERTWVLTFPYAGRGWVNHAVEAVASDIQTTGDIRSDACSGLVAPELHAVLSGSWPSDDNSVFCLFPSVEYERTLTEGTTKLNIGGTKYQFVEEGASADVGYIAVVRAASLEERLHNLARVANESAKTAYVFYKGKKLVVCDKTLASSDIRHEGIGSSGLDIVGGIVPVTVVYDANYEILGDVLLNTPTYVPSQIGNLTVTVFASGATSTNNYTCTAGTRLSAVAYDYAPESVYDYVMGLHPEVDYYFPPVPAQAAGLFVNGVEMENAALFKKNPTYLVGRKTMHWMEDDPGRLPWPSTIHHHDDPIDPRVDKTMVFYFVVGFQCSTGPVTSIVPAPGSQVKLYTYGTNDEAYTGDLMLDVALDMSVTDAGVTGYKVAKQGKGGKLLAGAVVERIKAGNGIVVTQESGCPLGQGTVTIGLDDGTLRGSFNEIALENAKQEKIGLFPYVSLLGWGESNNIPSAFTAMMRVPSNLDENTDYRLQLRMVMFGATGYTDAIQRAAGIQLEYNILPDYCTPEDKQHLSLKTGLLIPDNPRQISVPLGHYEGSSWTYVAYDPFVATTDAGMTKESDKCVPFSDLPIPTVAEFSTKVPELKPGYLVAIRVSRIATPDTQTYSAYTGPVGFLSMEWTLEEA